MGNVIALANRKGGVGKTTSTVNLAQGFIQAGKSVLVVDMDPQASLTGYYINDPIREDNLEEGHATLYWVLKDNGRPIQGIIISGAPALLPSSIQLSELEYELMIRQWGSVNVLRKALQPVRDQYDFILLDCPPTYGLLTINSLNAADGVLIPVKTDLLSVRGIPLLMNTISRVQAELNNSLRVLGVLPTFYKMQNTHDQGTYDKLKHIFQPSNIPVFEPINHSTFYDKSVGEGQSTLLAYPNTRGVDNYYKLAEYIINHA